MRERCKNHNYRSQCAYLVTLRCSEHCLPLAEILFENAGGRFNTKTELTKLGQQIISKTIDFVGQARGIELWNYAVMPDRIFLIINYMQIAVDELDFFIGRILENIGDDYFLKDFTDCILTNVPQLDAFREYIAAAPRRYAMWRSFPHLFNSARQIDIDGRLFTFFGNFQLLRHPGRMVVKISRSFTPELLAKLKAKWHETARTEGVLVSPFISAAEKQVMREALSGRGNVIRLHTCALTPDYRPDPDELELCRQGRLLIISPADIPAGQSTFDREKCLKLNDLARVLAGPIDAASIIAGMR